MINEQDIELIEKYLFGKLSEKEKTAFEQRLKNDKEFANEVDFMRDLKISSREFGREELKNKLKKIAHEHKAIEIKQNTGIRTYLAIAASIIVVIGIAALFYWTPSKNNSNNIAGLSGDSIEVNRIIANSAGGTKYFNINTVSDGYGYAETDSSAGNKLPVLIIHSDKYSNHYLFRDTLFLFLSSGDSLRFCSFTEQSNLLYFSQGKELFYFVELKKDMKLASIKKIDDKEVIYKIKKLEDNKAKN